jgi:iron complex transport system substrate-binding protein
MRAFATVLAASLLALEPAGAAAPARVASLNLCTDELLLVLAAPEQIVSVTHLAHKPAETGLWRQGRRYPSNDGSLVSVVALKPSLLVTMGGGARDRASIAERLRMRVLDLPFPQSIADVKRSIGTLAAALGRGGAGNRLIGQIEALEQSAPRRRHDAIWLGGGGRSVAPDGLSAQWMRLAGLKQRRLTGERASLEELLVRPPHILLRSDYRSGQYSAEQRWLSHPLARRPRRSRTLTTDGRPWTCMGPSMVAEVLRLRKALGR